MSAALHVQLFKHLVVHVERFENKNDAYQAALTTVNMQDAREARCNVMLDRSWGKAFAAMSLKPVMSEWRDAVSDALSRRGVLHCLLSSIMGGWNRRFRKNHFLAWKFYTSTIARGCDAKIALINGQLLADAFAVWAEAPSVSAQDKREGQMKDKLASLAEQLRTSQKGLYEAEQHKLALQSEATEKLEAVIKDKDLSIGNLLADKQQALAMAEADKDKALQMVRAEKETVEEALKEQKVAFAEAKSSNSILQSQAQATQEELQGHLDEALRRAHMLEEELTKTTEAGKSAAEAYEKKVLALHASHDAEMKLLSDSRQQQIDSLNSILKDHEEGRKAAWTERQALSQKVEDLNKELMLKEEQMASKHGQDEDKVRQLLSQIQELNAAEIDSKSKAAQQSDVQARLVANLEAAKASEAAKSQEIADLEVKLAKLEERRRDDTAELERETSELKDALMQQSGDLQANVSALQLREKKLQEALDKAHAELEDRASQFKALETDLRKRLSEGEVALSRAQVEIGNQTR